MARVAGTQRRRPVMCVRQLLVPPGEIYLRRGKDAELFSRP
jgi:hypothetical protein